jgi:ADP-heptose:LPS heptosyltransferase
MIHALALNRPGAIGDVLMTLNLLPALRALDPSRKIHYFLHPSYGGLQELGATLHAAGVDAIMDSNHWQEWDTLHEQAVNLYGYPHSEGHPWVPMRQHLLRFFMTETGLPATTELPALTLRRPARPADAPAGDYATLQPWSLWSKYKEWAWPRWAEVIRALPFPIVQIDARHGRTLDHSIALIANARIHLGVDSFAGHLTNYWWWDEQGVRRVPGVMLWGSTRAQDFGYPHNVNLEYGITCRPCYRNRPDWSVVDRERGPCTNPPRATYEDDTPPACLDVIGVEEVVNAALNLWSKP